MKIKFRGWGGKDKKWHCGYYVKIDDLSYIIEDNKEEYVRISPASVGMYIGIKDKNGKEIYGSLPGTKGGDIIARCGRVAVVEYMPSMARWVAKPIGTADYEVFYFDPEEMGKGQVTILDDTKVVGNAFEE